MVIDLTKVRLALAAGYTITEVAEFNKCTVHDLEKRIGIIERQDKNNNPVPITFGKETIVIDGCTFCGGDLYVDEGDLKCLQCSRELPMEEQNKLVRKLWAHSTR